MEEKVGGGGGLIERELNKYLHLIGGGGGACFGGGLI